MPDRDVKTLRLESTGNTPRGQAGFNLLSVCEDCRISGLNIEKDEDFREMP